jgi:hypothetical protein
MSMNTLWRNMKKIMIGILLNLFFVACNSSNSTNAQIVTANLSKDSTEVGLSNEELLSYMGVPRDEIECPNGFKKSRIKDSFGVINCKGDRGLFNISDNLSPYLEISSGVNFFYEKKDMKCSVENVLKMFPSFRANAKLESNKPNFIAFSMDEPIARSDLTSYRIFAGCDENYFVQAISTTLGGVIKIKNFVSDDVQELIRWIPAMNIYASCIMINKGKTAHEVALMFFPQMSKDLKNVIVNHPQKTLSQDKILKNFVQNFTLEKTAQGISEFQAQGDDQMRKERKEFCKTLK